MEHLKLLIMSLFRPLPPDSVGNSIMPCSDPISSISIIAPLSYIIFMPIAAEIPFLDPSQIKNWLRNCLCLVGRQWEIDSMPSSGQRGQEHCNARRFRFYLRSAAKRVAMSLVVVSWLSGSFYSILSALDFGICD